MKKIFKLLFVYLAVGALVTSCEEVETSFDAITKEPDASAGYYVQFIKAAQSFETSVSETGSLIEIEKPISVVLMGMPQSEPITVNLTVDPSSTITPSMYTLSANSITIPAGQTSGSVVLKTIANNMPQGQQLKLVLNLSAGEHNSPSATATKLTYNLKRIVYCPLVLAELVGNWSGKDSWDYNTEVETSIDGQGRFIINGIGFGWFQDWWGEVIVTNTPLVLTFVGLTGDFTIAEQPYLTSTYVGAPQPAYGMSATGKVDMCTKTMTINYVYHQGGSPFDGTAWGPKFKEVITLP